jgi:DNA-binding NarL/FixJ family response regulator
MTRVLLADDHGIFLAGLRRLLEQQGDLDVVGVALDGREAVRLAEELRPDVVVMDVTMPGLNGVEATRLIRERVPGARVIALSMHADRAFVMGMLQAGASGYLSKDSAADELVTAIRVVQDGKSYLSPQVTQVVVENSLSRQPARGGESRPLLSNREREVLQLIAEGKSTREIAMFLQLGEKTVETYRRRIMGKLDLRSLAELVKYAIREGLTGPGR